MPNEYLSDFVCVCVYYWVSNTLTGRAQVHTRAASEMLCRRLKDLVEKYQLTVDVMLVPLTLNWLMRVLQWWFDAMRRVNRPRPLIGAIHIDELDTDQIMSIHRNSGHPGVWHTTDFVRRVCPPITRSAVRSSIWACEEWQLIDPAPIHWEKGELEVNRNW